MSIPPRRRFHVSAAALHDGEYEMEPPKSPEDVVNLTFIDRAGKKHAVAGKVGDNLMLLAHVRSERDIPEIYLEGACETSLACSTCHVVLDDASYDRLDEPCEEEEDMLDMAACLTSTSRLGCQIVLSKDMEGMVVTLPKYSKNFYVDQD